MEKNDAVVNFYYMISGQETKQITNKQTNKILLTFNVLCEKKKDQEIDIGNNNNHENHKNNENSK